MALQPLPLQDLRYEFLVTTMVEHLVNIVVGECSDRGDSRQGVRFVQTEPARQLGIASAALQRRIPADELGLVQKNAPAGKTD